MWKKESYDLAAHLTRQYAFSKATFGPGPRHQGVIAHIQSEFDEIDKELKDGNLQGAAKEWVDVVILGLDGLMRAVQQIDTSMVTEDVVSLAIGMLNYKQNKNENRTWPDWRQFDQSQPINHDRSKD